MKGLFSKLGQLADSIAAYNEGGAPTVATSQAPKATGATINLADDPVLAYLLRNTKSTNVRKHFFQTPVKSYTSHKDIRVLACSYNVNGKKPPPGFDIGPWIGLWKNDWPAGELGGKDLPDIVAVGFQEIVPLNAGNVIVGSAAENLMGWDRAIGAHLNGEAWAIDMYGSNDASQVIGSMDTQWQQGTSSNTSSGGTSKAVEGAWVQVAAKQLVGNYLSVWIRRSLLPHVRGVQATSTATGFGGYLGNKGAVVVRLRVYDSPLVFVAAHLSAGEQEGDELRRNNDVAEILRRTDFSILGDSTGTMSSPLVAKMSASLSPAAGHWDGVNLIADHGSVIWVGDLNYRLANTVISDDEVRAALKAGRLQPLLDADQLIKEMTAGRVFTGGWKEGPITFQPTFKFKVGTHVYLGDPSLSGSASTAGFAPSGDDMEEPGTAAAAGAEKQKKRTPAWCDRVLWLNSHGRLHQLSYNRAELAASDHKPVAGAFLFQAQYYDRKQVDTLLQEARRVVDMTAAMLKPRGQLEPIQVTVPDVLHLGQVSRHSIKLNNTGKGDGMWHFISSGTELDDDLPALPPWLKACPMEGVIPPGASCDITLEMCVEGGPGGAADSLAAAAKAGSTAGPIKLDTIVIIRMEDANDMFLCVNGSCQLGFLGLSVSTLLKQEKTPGGDVSSDDEQVVADVGQLIKQGSAGLPYLQNKLRQAVGLPPLTPGSPLTNAAELGKLVPKAWRNILFALSDDAEGLETDGLFATSVSHVMGRESGQDASVLKNRTVLRELVMELDGAAQHMAQHKQLLEGVGTAGVSHTLAALLCASLAQLPQPLLPTQLADTAGSQDMGLSQVDKILTGYMAAPEAALLCAVRAVLEGMPCLQTLHMPAPGAQHPLQPMCDVLEAVLLPATRSDSQDNKIAARRSALMLQFMLGQPAVPVL